jgi:hypothetical protein
MMKISFKLLDYNFGVKDINDIYHNSFGEFEYIIDNCKIFEQISNNKFPKFNLIYLINNYYDCLSYIKSDIGDSLYEVIRKPEFFTWLNNLNNYYADEITDYADDYVAITDWWGHRQLDFGFLSGNPVFFNCMKNRDDFLIVVHGTHFAPHYFEIDFNDFINAYTDFEYLLSQKLNFDFNELHKGYQNLIINENINNIINKIRDFEENTFSIL